MGQLVEKALRGVLDCVAGTTCDPTTNECVATGGGGGGGQGIGGGAALGGGGGTGLGGGTATGGGSAGGGGVGTGGGGSTCTSPDTWTNYASNWFATYCSRCHSDAWSSYANVQSDSQSLQDVISSGAMPRGGGLSEAERQRLLAWIACGLPQ